MYKYMFGYFFVKMLMFVTACFLFSVVFWLTHNWIAKRVK